MENRSRLFVASCMALVVTAMSFAVRGGIMGDLEIAFGLSKEQLGWINGTAFWGFTVAMMLGGPLCDVVGMKRLVWLAFIGQGLGMVVTIFATGFATLYAGTLLIGIGNGFVEAACNPLVATVYPDAKTKMLNRFHVWFPGGIVIGALLTFGISEVFKPGAGAVLAAGPGGVGDLWQWKMVLMIPPLLVYGYLFFGQKFPVTERVAIGVSTGAMFKECLRPLFILMLAAMALTASTELGPNQWITNIVTFTAGVSGLLVLAWISGIMAIGRQFAGPVVHRLSPSGVLLMSAILSTIGLFLLSKATSGVAAFGASAVFAVGVCYFWPTMLGFVAERFPRSGALGLSTIGGVGMLAVSFVQPWMGKVYDTRIDETIPPEVLAAAVPAGDALAEVSKITDAAERERALEAIRLKAARDALIHAPEGTDAGETWRQVQAQGGAEALLRVASLPAILIVVFGGIYLSDRRKGASNDATREE
jgi:MFS transporter